MADQTQTYGHDFGDVIDQVKPKHYTFRVEPIDISDSYQLPHYEATILAYVARYHLKETPKADLAKALWYTLRLMNNIRSFGLRDGVRIGDGGIHVTELIEAMSLSDDQALISKILVRARLAGNPSERLGELNEVVTKLSHMIQELH